MTAPRVAKSLDYEAFEVYDAEYVDYLASLRDPETGAPVFPWVDYDQGCECEIDWSCGLHAGRPTFLESRYQDDYEDEMEARAEALAEDRAERAAERAAERRAERYERMF